MFLERDIFPDPPLPALEPLRPRITGEWDEGPIARQAARRYGSRMPPAAYVAIVDDEEPVRRALVRLLRSAGHEAQAFASGKQLLESLPERLPSCILLDLHMPDMSGLDVQQRLAQQWPRLPIIFITGHHSPETEHRARAAGPCAYLLKPVNDRQLLDAIALATGASEPSE